MEKQANLPVRAPERAEAPAPASARRSRDLAHGIGQGLTWRRLLLGAGALALVAMIAIALWPRPVPIDVAIVTRGPMTVTVDEEGKTRIRNVFTVSAPITGKMMRSPLLAGDLVEKGKTLVAVIQPTAPPFLDFRSRREIEALAKAAEAAVALAEAEVVQARSELTFAESELQRARTLAKSSTVPVKTLERATVDVAVRTAAVARAEANLTLRQRELDSARARLLAPTDDPGAGDRGGACCLEVRAPESGRVLKVLHQSEQAVTIGTPLVEIGDPKAIEVVVDLLSTDAVRIREGAAAEIDGWGGRQKIAARVRRIEAAGFTKVSALGIEEQRVRVVLDLVPDAGPGTALGHEFRVFVRIREWEGQDVLRIPIGALFRQGASWATFKSVSGRAVLARIQIGSRNADMAEVTGGLAAGERVVMHPSDRISEGVRVSERKVEASEAP